MKRRRFLQTGLAAGAGALWSAAPALVRAEHLGDVIHVALVGAGAQGRILLSAALAIPRVRFVGVCDIWKYRRTPAVAYLKTYGHEAREYEDYRDMLGTEKDLHAVVIATPDFVHAEQTIACLQAGLHVYCEAMLSPSTEQARAMVQAMQQTGKLLQAGYQRRSNPRYLHVYEKLLKEAELTGQITHAAARWNHPVADDLGWPRRVALPDDLLARYGYANMHEFRNWRWFKRYGAGPLAGFGAHQVDVFQWFLGAMPSTVLAAGGTDYYKNRPWYDNGMVIYEFPTAEGTVRAFYHVLTTTSGGGEGNYEMLMGTEGAIKISEQAKWTKAFREASAPDWDDWVRRGYLVKSPSGPNAAPSPPGSPEAASSAAAEVKPEDPYEVRVRETGQVVAYDIPVTLDTSAYQPHLENFFDAIRGKTRLNCPADVAFRAEVAVLKANQAIEAKRMLPFGPEEFNALASGALKPDATPPSPA